MSFRGPKIIKVAGGLGQQNPSSRNVAGLIIANGYEVSTTWQHDTVYELNSLAEAEALGLSASTDANAVATCACLTWYHISEFFRLNPDGKLYVYNGDAETDLFAADGPADLLMAAAANSIRFIGVVFGFDPTPSEPYEITAGFASFVGAAAGAAQTWVDARAEAHVYVDCVVVEGAWAATTLVDLKALDRPQVHVTVACDYGHIEPMEEAGALRTAAVGTVLGSIGVRMLSESIGSLTLERYPAHARGQANYSLVSVRHGRWLKVGLSTGQVFNDLSQAVRDELTTKAYGYAGTYEGYSGVYINGDATCTLATDDFNSIRINRVWNECARGVRRALTPRINSRVRIDPATGQIEAATIADWDAAAKRELHALHAEGEIADFTFGLDPAQDVIAQAKVITTLSVVPQGIAKVIESEIGFINPAQAA